MILRLCGVRFCTFKTRSAEITALLTNQPQFSMVFTLIDYRNDGFDQSLLNLCFMCCASIYGYCYIAGKFEAGNSLNLTVTAVVGKHLWVTVHCYPLR